MTHAGQGVESQMAFVASLTEPDEHSLCSAVDKPHMLNLAVALEDIFLVDADGVGPRTRSSSFNLMWNKAKPVLLHRLHKLIVNNPVIELNALTICSLLIGIINLRSLELRYIE